MQQNIHKATIFGPACGGRWHRRALQRMRVSVDRVAETLALWHFRARSRRELEQLEDRLLRDIGVDRSEAYKPFWRE